MLFRNNGFQLKIQSEDNLHFCTDYINNIWSVCFSKLVPIAQIQTVNLFLPLSFIHVHIKKSGSSRILAGRI